MSNRILELPVAICRAARRCYYGIRHGLRKFLLGYREARNLQQIADQCEPPDADLMKRLALYEGPNIDIAAAEAKLEPGKREFLQDQMRLVSMEHQELRTPDPLNDTVKKTHLNTIVLGDGSKIVIKSARGIEPAWLAYKPVSQD